MRLIGRPKLQAITEADQNAAKWVANWTAALRDAHWKRPADVNGQFPKARRQADGSFLFPIPQRQIAVHVLIVFSQGVALIISIKVFEAANGH